MAAKTGSPSEGQASPAGAYTDTDIDDGGTPRQSGAGRALLHLLIAGVLLGAGLYVYSVKVAHEKKLHELQKNAQGFVKVGTPQGYKLAVGALKEALAIDDEDAYSHAALAVAAARLWGEHGVDEYKADAVTHAAAATALGEKIAERYAAEALVAHYDGKTEAALKELDALTKQTGLPALLAGTMGVLQFAVGKTDDALTNFQRAHDLEADFPAWPHAVGRAFLRRGEVDTASVFFAKTLQRRPDHPWAILDKNLIAIRRREDLAKATRNIDEVMADEARLSPAIKAHGMYARAWVLFLSQRPDEALAALAQAEQLRGGQADHDFLRGEIAKLQGKLNDAVSHYARAVQRDPYTREYYFVLARAQLEAGAKDGALATLENYKRNLPETADYHLAASKVFIDAADYTRAMEHIEKASAMDGWTAEALFHKGLVLQRQKKFKEAAETYEEVVALDEGYPEVYHEVCHMSREQGAVEEALQYCNDAMRYYAQRGVARTVIAGIWGEIASMFKQLKKPKEARAAEEAQRQMLQ